MSAATCGGSVLHALPEAKRLEALPKLTLVALVVHRHVKNEYVRHVRQREDAQTHRIDEGIAAGTAAEAPLGAKPPHSAGEEAEEGQPEQEGKAPAELLPREPEIALRDKARKGEALRDEDDGYHGSSNQLEEAMAQAATGSKVHLVPDD
mmetsp:Transcript_11603/g.15610  ORF Transcript_11603/g.15610 Transcript_11603/m.15610 type:complete len:150 (+) Transcript_11603:650-1099(+)